MAWLSQKRQEIPAYHSSHQITLTITRSTSQQVTDHLIISIKSVFLVGIDHQVWEVPRRQLAPFYFFCSTGKTSTSLTPNFQGFSEVMNDKALIGTGELVIEERTATTTSNYDHLNPLKRSLKCLKCIQFATSSCNPLQFSNASKLNISQNILLAFFNI